MVYGLAARSAAREGADTATALSPVNARRSFFIIEPHTFLSPSEGRCFHRRTLGPNPSAQRQRGLTRHFGRFCDSQKLSNCRRCRRSRNPDLPIRWTNRGLPPTSHIATGFWRAFAPLALRLACLIDVLPNSHRRDRRHERLLIVAIATVSASRVDGRRVGSPISFRPKRGRCRATGLL